MIGPVPWWNVAPGPPRRYRHVTGRRLRCAGCRARLGDHDVPRWWPPSPRRWRWLLSWHAGGWRP